MNTSAMMCVLGLSGGELILILMFFFALMACIVIGVTLAIFFRRKSKPIEPKPGLSSPVVAPASPVTKRVCPKCGADLVPGAPGGLCPRCLMQAGFASQLGENAPKPQQPPPAPADIAQHFPNLEILETLGQGGMGVVYKARQPQLERMVALKILSPELSRDPAFAERFSREARALARLNHPNIVTVFDFGQAGGFYYLIMEYVDGLNLWQMEQAKKRLTPEEAIAIVPKICDALQYAHDEGIVHRDIKPANILIDTKGRVKIADFGLAKLLGRESQLNLTQSRATMGTPQYMAPEQIEKPLQVDHRADIYSLGVVFYEMLTGELPLGRFAPPSAKVQMDVRLDEVVLRTLEKEPERRYQQASQVKCDVQTIATNPGQGGGQAPPPPPQNPGTPPAVPPQGAAPGPSQDDNARKRVSAPGIALIVLGVLNIFAGAVSAFLMMIFTFRVANVGGPRMNPAWAMMTLLAIPLFYGALSVLLIVAGTKMRRLKAYPLALTASVLAILLPPFNFLLLGLAIGAWSLAVLLDSSVREAFEANRTDSNRPSEKATKNRTIALAAGLVLLLFLAVLIFGGFWHLAAPRPVAQVDAVQFFEPRNGTMTLTEGNPVNALSFGAPDEESFIALDQDQSARDQAIDEMRRTGQLSGVNAIFDLRNRSILFMDTVVIPTDNQTALTIQPSSKLIIPGSPNTAEPIHKVEITNTPVAYLFKTKSRVGVIQILSAGGTPLSMTVQYKSAPRSPEPESQQPEPQQPEAPAQ